MHRTRVRMKRPGPPRRGRLIDTDYMEWMHTQVCLVSGKWPVTVHHVRRHGEPKDDHRIVPLIAEYHMHDFGMTSVERLGKALFEQLFEVDLEAAILDYNRKYVEEGGEL